MEKNILNNKINNLSANPIVQQISLQQLIDLVCDSPDSYIGSETKQELINRGRDNIQTRIQIKKTYKTKISSFESILEKAEKETRSDSETIKTYKNKFLTLISILDRLQLEWQKYDLGLKY